MMTFSDMINLLMASYESWLVLLVTAVTCALIGSFLVLRNLSMIADAISHSVLLGIILGFFIAGDLDSPWLIFGAAALGVVTVWSTETLSKTGLVESDDAVGIVYPLFFALAVILITRFASNVHLDTDVVLTGEVILTPLDRVELFGFSLPTALFQMSLLLGVNALFIVIFFKELKLTTFDNQYGHLLGFNAGLLFYVLMTLNSVTTVLAFDAVGAILVVAFLVGPGASAYLFCKDLKQMLVVAMLYGIINATLGYFIGIAWNVSIGGMAAVMTGVTFFLTFLFHRQGLLTALWLRYRQSKQLRYDLVLLHIYSHTLQGQEKEELRTDCLDEHFKWSKKEVDKALTVLFKADYVTVDTSKQVYRLTPAGLDRIQAIQQEYGI